MGSDADVAADPVNVWSALHHLRGMRDAVEKAPNAAAAALTAAEKSDWLRGDTRCTATLPLPALSPKMVTREASPPNACMFSWVDSGLGVSVGLRSTVEVRTCTHCMARRWSCRPQLPVLPSAARSDA